MAVQVLEVQAAAGEWKQHAAQWQRTAGVVTGVLRLAVAATAVQPANKGVQREALAFVQAHSSAIASLLQSAGTATPRCAALEYC